MSSPPLDDRDGTIWYNGRLVPWRDAKFHVLTHSLHYGNAAIATCTFVPTADTPMTSAPRHASGLT